MHRRGRRGWQKADRLPPEQIVRREPVRALLPSVSSIDLRPATLGAFKRGSISRQAIQTLFIAEWVECLPSTFASNQTPRSIPARERDPGTAEREAAC